MNQANIINLPIIGKIQHGEQIETPNGGKRAKELGYFIAKIQNNYMQKFLLKFNEMHKGKQYLEIEFCNDNPLSKKYVRYNQGGDVCHCIEGQITGSQKNKNGWQSIECNTRECQYRQRNAEGKTACNRVGWLRFLIPSICKDRIWLMKITSQTSINRLDNYIKMQKILGNSVKGHYIIFLKQEEQTNTTTGQKYNNYVLDILKKEDFIISNQIPQITQTTEQLSTEDKQNVNNDVENKEQTTSLVESSTTNKQEKEQEKPSKTSKKSNTSKNTDKKNTKSKTKKTEEKKIEESNFENDKNNMKNYYALLNTFTETLVDKQGNSKEYLIGEFTDMQDKISNIVIRPEDANELAKCDLGTFVRLDIREVGGKKFAMKLEFVEKRLKKVAA